MTSSRLHPIAGNGLLDRREFLRSSLAAGAGLMVAAPAATGAVSRREWMTREGAPLSPVSEPAPLPQLQRKHVASRPGTSGSGASRTPLQHLDGIITPNRLHFERHHSGIPAVDADVHQLVIHGMVKQPLAFKLNTLLRYPHESALRFLECSGNSAALIAPKPVDDSCSGIHGLVSASEWGGVRLSVLLDEAGLLPGAKWLVAEGADAAMMSRSIPLAKALDDALVATHQNGEPLYPANGYPMRLFLPGWEGNTSIKWLRSIRVVDQPAMTREETSKYSDLDADGQARLFTFAMGVKSVITSPSPGLAMAEPGVYQISGLAWSGAGRIRAVDVSADGGRSWAAAELDATVQPKCLTRFRAAWRWDGATATLLSRAVDETGAMQPTRAVAMQGRAPGSFYHYNGIQAWRVNADGKVNNVYA